MLFRLMAITGTNHVQQIIVSSTCYSELMKEIIGKIFPLDVKLNPYTGKEIKLQYFG